MSEQSNNRPSSRLPGFYKLPVSERLDRLMDMFHLTAEEIYELKREALSMDIADQMVENVIGVFGMPLGLAANFLINGKDYLIPMAVEESSVVAAAGHLAKLVREHGEITTDSTEPVMIGQIQVVGISDPEAVRRSILDAKDRLLHIANEQDPMLHDLGGGAKEIEVRILDSIEGPMVVIHLYVDVRDAMGANAVNTMCEALALYVEGLTGGKVYLRIISNLSDRRLARARLRVAPKAFNEHDWQGEDVVVGLLNAYAFALADPYRAATHNKGIMNAIDAVMIATGNDWRAIEAGAHAYAARDGQYKPLSTWTRSPEGDLVGEIELPMAVGLIGGATRVHPIAKLALKILAVENARELAEVAAAVGLVQNLAAMRSLVTEGIQKGHMVLHARNVAISAGAVGDTVLQVSNQMIREGKIRLDRAKDILRHILKGAEKTVQDFEARLRGNRAKAESNDQEKAEDKSSDGV